MGLAKKFFNQTRKPQGFWGNVMLSSMNSGHAPMADWGMGHLNGVRAERILEIGCGVGRNAGELLKRFPSAYVTAIDHSPASVTRTAEYNRAILDARRCAVREGNVAALNYPAESFDLATAFETVYFWPGLEPCFAQVAKVLKPGGRFMIVNESDGTDAASLRFEKIIDGMWVYTVEEIEASLKAAGFAGVKTDHHLKKPWITVFAEK